MIRIKYNKKILVFIFCVIFLVCIYFIFFQRVTYSGYTASEVPEWLLNNIVTSSIQMDEEPGPAIASGTDSYAAFKIRFYDASTKEQIIDYTILEELLSMFQYTEEPFVYDKERSRNGVCFFYYNGILPADYFASIFSGYKGEKEFLKYNSQKIKSFYMLIHTTTVDAVNFNTIEEALDLLTER